MSEEKHTPEPWHVERGSKIYAEEFGRLIGECHSDPNYGANAHRIVACVNACTGIDTDVLESVTLMIQMRGHLLAQKQRDELLKAAKKSKLALAPLVEDDPHPLAQDAYNDICAAIAKCETK